MKWRASAGALVLGVLCSSRARADGLGEASFDVVERTGTFLAKHPERGESGRIAGSGFGVRFMMPQGVGAYYRLLDSSTHHLRGAEWAQGEFAFGFSGRLHSTGDHPWHLRTQSHLDGGLLYTSLGTQERCTQTLAPLGRTCDTFSPGRDLNASGAGFGAEIRLGGDLGIGPLSIGVDIGVAGYRRWSTGGNSVSIPPWFAIPSVQLRLGLALPISR